MTSGAPGTLTNFLSLCRWTWLTWRGLTSWRRRPTDGSSSTCWRRCWHSTPTNGSPPWRRWTIHSLPWRTCCTSLTAHSKTTRSAVDDHSRYRSMFSFATAAVKPPSVSLTVFRVFYSVKSCFQNMDICKRRCSAFENGKNMFASNNTPSAATNLTVTFSSQLNQHNQVRTLSVTCRRVFFFILLSNILLDPCWRFYRSLITVMGCMFSFLCRIWFIGFFLCERKWFPEEVHLQYTFGKPRNDFFQNVYYQCLCYRHTFFWVLNFWVFIFLGS